MRPDRHGLVVGLQILVGALVVATLHLSPVGHLVAALVLGAVAIRCRGLEAGLFALWSGAAGAAFVLVAVEAVADVVVPAGARVATFAFGAVLASEAWRRRGVQRAFDLRLRPSDRLLVAGLLAWCVGWAPRSSVGALGLLYPEDNQKWMMSVASELRGEVETLAVPLGSVNVQYFVRFVLGILTPVSTLGRDRGDVAALTLITQANGWMWGLATILVLTPVVVRLSAEVFELRRGASAAVVGAVASAIFAFGQAQSVGHFTQFLLTVSVVVVALLLLHLVDPGAPATRRWLLVPVVVTGAAVGGSYNPWLPIGIVAIVVGTCAVVPLDGRALVRRPAVLAAGALGLLAAVVVSAGLFDRFANDLDMEGGVSVTHLEALVVCVVTAIASAGRVLPVGRRGDAAKGMIGAGGRSTAERLTAAPSWTAILAIGGLLAGGLLGATESQLVSVAAASLLGLVLAGRSAAPDVGTRGVPADARRHLVLLLPLAALLWTLLIWVASRYASPVRAPRFAAWKSIVALIGQFGWIPILVVSSIAWSRVRVVQWVVTAAAAAGIFVTFGYRSRVGESYVQERWWHRPVLSTLARDPERSIVCVSGEVGAPDYETYTCNRYLQTLGTESDLSGTFRYLAWYRSENVGAAADLLDGAGRSVVTVVAPGPLSESWQAFFRDRVRLELDVVRG